MKNELFEALYAYLKERSSIEEMMRASQDRRLRMEFDLEKAERVVSCKSCDRMIPAIEYEYEVFTQKDWSHYAFSHMIEESTFLRCRCPFCKEIQETRLIKKEMVT